MGSFGIDLRQIAGDAATTYVSNNASEFVGVSGTDGVDGESVYEAWLRAGNSGTLNEFTNAMRGDDGIDGIDGKSAYQVWLDEGNSGNEEAFLLDITGNDGDDGRSIHHVEYERSEDSLGNDIGPVDPGYPGNTDTYGVYADQENEVRLGELKITNAFDAYKMAVETGYEGTSEEFYGAIADVGTALDAAETNAILAEKWATSDVEVEDGKYSAKYWSDIVSSTLEEGITAGTKRIRLSVDTDGQTEFTVPQGYVAGLLDVYIDGSYEVDRVTATGGDTFTIEGGLVTESTLDVVVFKLLSIADTYSRDDLDDKFAAQNDAIEIVYDGSDSELEATKDTDNVQDAIAEIDAAVKLNTDKETNVTTDLSWDASNSKVVSSDGDDAVITVVDSDNAGLMTVDDKSRLDAIEDSATADQTDAEIETAYNNRVSVATDTQIKDGDDSTVYRVTPELVNSAIAKQVGELNDGQVTTNKNDIATLNADSATTGSVDEKIKTQVTDQLVDNVVDGGSTKYLSAEQGKLLDERITTLKTTVEMYLVENDGDTVFAIANNVDEPLRVELEGFPLYDSEYDRDANGITLHDGASKNETVYLVAYNG